MNNTPIINQRLVIFDIVRILSLFAIIFFHIHEVFFGTIEFGKHTALYTGLIWVSRFISFSGHTIILVSAFLLANNHFKKEKRKKLLYFLAGASVLVFASHFFLYGFEWDIYQFLILALLSTFLIKDAKKINWWIAINGLLMLIPYWELNVFSPLPRLIQIPLVGLCEQFGAVGLWPLFPWLFFFLFFYSLGLKYFHHKEFQNKLAQFHKTEFVVWPILLIGSVFNWGPYFDVEFGNQFYCFINKKNPLVLWSHLIWVIAILRLGLINQIRYALVKKPWVWFSNLAWSRKFGLAYLLHLILLNAFGYMSEIILQNPIVFDVFVLSLFPATELILRLLEKRNVSKITGSN